DSGCSRSMTGNKEKLDDFVQVKGGTVTFGGGDGKITGKGTIRTFKLDFENAYYVEELRNFNLFSVVLHIPRRHDIYTFKLSDIQPEQHINCLLAKASLKESTKWHKRMAHMNFKTINKLAKLGLVEGLPLKLFTNEHNCVACNKGKQHKASYKAFFLGPKDETFYILKDFIALIENQLTKKVKAIRCEAVSTACYVLNRVSITNPHNKIPYELLSWKVPNIRHLKPFGCQVTILNTSEHLGKFKGKANDGFLVGYAAHSKAYRVCNLSSKKVEETLNLRYLEDKPNVQGLGQECHPASGVLAGSIVFAGFGDPAASASVPAVLINAPTTTSPLPLGHSLEEMQQFYHQQVWKLVPFPAGKIAIGTKWILKKKRDARRIVVRNKARLVAQGHRQEEGIEYDEVYVDDIIFGSTNKAWCDEFELLMKGKFKMSAMGEMEFFLELQVKQLPDGIFISQDKYVKDMLKKFDIERNPLLMDANFWVEVDILVV
nr:hypothetical protein [Tanacetum cinerariifolium]